MGSAKIELRNTHGWLGDLHGIEPHPPVRELNPKNSSIRVLVPTRFLPERMKTQFAVKLRRIGEEYEIVHYDAWDPSQSNLRSEEWYLYVNLTYRRDGLLGFRGMDRIPTRRIASDGGEFTEHISTSGTMDPEAFFRAIRDRYTDPADAERADVSLDVFYGADDLKASVAGARVSPTRLTIAMPPEHPISVGAAKRDRERGRRT